MQKARLNKKPVGRPPRFNREEVVSGAVQAFWSNGFAGTTLDELETATGVDRSTLYNSFGGKEGLYRSATSAYVSAAEGTLFEPLYQGTDGVADIIDFFDRLSTNLGETTNPCGCLIVNDMANPADPEATARYLELLERGLEAALGRASLAGETEPDRASDQCRFLTAAVVGINLISRNAADNAAGQALVASVRSEVLTWKSRPAS